MIKHSRDYAHQAFRILQFGFVFLPIIAGIDKFANILVRWGDYLSPFALRFINGNVNALMSAVGVVEIIAGIGVLLNPRLFAYIICLWLLLIIINLLQTGMYYDIALRDFGLLLAAWALGRLSRRFA